MGTVPQQIPVWNQFDEFGLLTGLGHWSDDKKTLTYVRYPGETNKQLKQRTLTNSANPGNGTLQGMLNNITRDLSISLSGTYNLPIYNTVTKNFFYLSQKPYPSASGVNVFVSTSGSWSSANQVFPQVRASGYPTATSGWIVWNIPDFDPSTIPAGLPGSSGWFNTLGISGQFIPGIQEGEYLQVLEFIGSSIPDTGDRIRVDYQIQTGIDIYGQVTLDWRTDFSHPDNPLDLTFVGSKSDYPTNSGDYTTFKSGNVSIFTLDQLSDPTISGVFYDSLGKPTSKLIEIAKLVNTDYPLYWNNFSYDIGRWGQLDQASVGSIPSFHDEGITNGSGFTIKGGSKYGIDLNCVQLTSANFNARSPWYPLLVPGEFYVGSQRYYLFGSMQYVNLNLSTVSGILSGNINIPLASSIFPLNLGLISAYSSGRFYTDSNLPNNPYIKRLHAYVNPLSGVYYRSPLVNYSGGYDLKLMMFDGNNFYFDYSTGNIYASGINPTGFILTWEHPDVYGSGLLVTYSGGYGLSAFDFNPLTDPFDKVLYLY